LGRNRGGFQKKHHGYSRQNFAQKKIGITRNKGLCEWVTGLKSEPRAAKAHRESLRLGEGGA